MTRWFKLAKGSSYEWKSKASGKYYMFRDDKTVEVVHPEDQTRFKGMPDRFTEVDQKGNVIDPKTGQTIPKSFSAKGMVAPKSYMKLAKPPASKPPQPEPAPRKVVSSTKAEPPAPEATVEPAEAPAQAEVTPEITEGAATADPQDAEKASDEAGDASDSSEKSDDAPKSRAPRKRKKKSSKKKKSGRKGDK